MKRLLFFAGLLSILASCSKEPQEGPQQPETKALEVALMTDLSERTSLDKVVLSDGELTRSVSLTASDNLDPDQADALVFNSADADSVDLTVAPGYVAIRMTVDGRQKAWIAYPGGRRRALRLAGRRNQIGFGRYDPQRRGGRCAVPRPDSHGREHG